MADGARHSLRLIPEVTYGVTPATPAFETIRHTSCSLSLSKEALQSAELRSDRQIATFRQGANQTGGDIGVEFSYGSFDTILEALLGGTWAADTPSLGTDQLKAGTTRRSFTLERYFSDIQSGGKPYHRFTGVEFNTLALNIGANAMVTATFGTVGSGMATDTAIITGATYPAASTTEPLDSFTGVLTEGGSTIAVVTELTLNLTNGLESRFVVGSADAIRPSIARSNLTGQVTAYFEDSALLDKFINETSSSLVVTLPDLDGNQYKLTVPKLKYTGGQPDVAGEGPITISLPFQAVRDAATATNIIVERTAA